MLTGQIKHGPTGEAEGNCRQSAGEIWPKTRREPIPVTDWIIELEALTFFTHFFKWEMKIYTQEEKEHLQLEFALLINLTDALKLFDLKF